MLHVEHCLIKMVQQLSGYTSSEGQLDIMYRNEREMRAIKVTTSADAVKSLTQDWT